MTADRSMAERIAEWRSKPLTPGQKRRITRARNKRAQDSKCAG